MITACPTDTWVAGGICTKIPLAVAVISIMFAATLLEVVPLIGQFNVVLVLKVNDSYPTCEGEMV
jgi:hypothetical protein